MRSHQIQTVPETPGTIRTQLSQLAQGKRRVVMLPKGTTAEASQRGMGSYLDDAGNRYIFNPSLANAGVIEQALESNSLTDLLGATEGGMGAPDKLDVLARGGRSVVVARGRDGETAQATLTDEQSLPRTIQQTRKLMPPGGTVSTESPEREMARRGMPRMFANKTMQRGKIPKMFTGGIVDPYDPDDPRNQIPPMPGEAEDMTAPPPMPRPPTEMSRFDTPMPDAPPAMPSDGPPAMPEAMGRNPMYRRGLMAGREQQDAMPPQVRQQGPPPMPNTDAYNRRLREYEIAAAQKVPMWRQAVGAALGISPRLAGIGQAVATNQKADRIGRTLPAFKAGSDEERLQQQAQQNAEFHREQVRTQRANQESLNTSRLAAEEDRQLKMATDPNLEEERQGEQYRGTVDISGKKYGVIRPEVLAERKKQAEQVNWIPTPKMIMEENPGLPDKLPAQVLDTYVRLYEARGQREQATELKRELAANEEKLKRELADQNNQVRRDIATQNNETRRQTAATAANSKPPSSAERRAENFYIRAEDASRDLDAMQEEMAKKGLFDQFAYEHLPNFLQSDLNQQYRQSQRSFTEARLRKDSGAAIPPHEFENDARMYFPQPGDSKATLEKKQKSRQTILRALKQEAGRAAVEVSEAQPPQQSAGGQVSVTDPRGKVHLFPNKKAADAFKAAAGIK